MFYSSPLYVEFKTFAAPFLIVLWAGFFHWTCPFLMKGARVKLLVCLLVCGFFYFC